MNEFFGNVKQYLTDAAEEVTKKAEETIEVQKIKSQIRTLQRNNERDFKEIGRLIYDAHKNQEETLPDYVELCEEITKREAEIEKLNKKIS